MLRTVAHLSGQTHLGGNVFLCSEGRKELPPQLHLWLNGIEFPLALKVEIVQPLKAVV
jgi:hypothetical protein